jgi:hypothetical protein
VLSTYWLRMRVEEDAVFEESELYELAVSDVSEVDKFTKEDVLSVWVEEFDIFDVVSDGV